MSIADASSRLARRGFLARLSAAAGAAALLTTPAPLRAAIAPAARAGNPGDPDAWIDRVRGRDRLLVHAHQHLLPALTAAHGVLADARDGYGVPERENGVALGTHGPAIAGMFTDDTWRRHALGERYGFAGRDGGAPAPVVENPFLRPQEGAPPEATVDALMERGVVFLVCNVAVRNLSRRLVREGEPAEPVHAALLAGLLPGVVVVPNVFVAISHGQKRGLGYLFID